MLIEQYIYTRLTAEQSPQKSTGFQSAFMPAGLKGKLHSVSLESHIHLPALNSVLDKRTVFWVEIEQVHWQVILFVSSLPEARDEFGRAGLYLVHGFLLPPAIWTQYRNPLRIAHLLEEHRFTNIDEVLQSPLVDRKKGLISPIDPGVFPMDDAEGSAPPANDNERAMLALMYRITEGTANGSAVVYKGNTRTAEQLFGRMAAFLPQELKVRLAWDSAFDGGKLFFAPVNAVAYSVVQPVTGYQAQWQQGQDRIDFADDAQAELVRPNDPFSRWLGLCMKQSHPAAEVDEVYALARILQRKLPFSDAPAEACFARVNEDAIRDWLCNGTDPMLAKEWREPIAKYLTGKEIHELAMAGFSDACLAKAVARAILRGQLTPQNFKFSPPARLLPANDPRLVVLSSMWTKTPVKTSALLDIVVEDREQILKLFARNGTTREEAKALGFTGDEIQVADADFVGGFGRLLRKMLGR